MLVLVLFELVYDFTTNHWTTKYKFKIRNCEKLKRDGNPFQLSEPKIVFDLFVIKFLLMIEYTNSVFYKEY